jgi:outer membrane receptor protein involved in Fe transport
LIASSFYTSRQDDAYIENDPTISIKEAGYQSEVQYLYHPGLFNITAGLGYSHFRQRTINFFFDTSDLKPRGFYNAYVYSKQEIHPTLITVLGIGFDSYHFDGINDRNREQFSPKFGVMWKPINRVTFRSAAFRTLTRPIVSNQTIEPTQVAGFNQFFDSDNGTSAWQYALGVDYTPLNNLFLGGEATWRKASYPLRRINQKGAESHHLAYFYWTLSKWISFRSEYRYDKSNRESLLPNENFPSDLITHQVPLSVNFFHSNGLFVKITGTYVNQHATFIGGLPNSLVLNEYSDTFWTVDTSLGFRLPKKIGLISFEVRNLFDKQFNYQSTFDASGPQISPFVPERQFFAKLSLFY